MPGRQRDADSHLPQVGKKPCCSVLRPRTPERSPAHCTPSRAGGLLPRAGSRSVTLHTENPSCGYLQEQPKGSALLGSKNPARGGGDQHRLPRQRPVGKPRSRCGHRGIPEARGTGRLPHHPAIGVPAAAGGSGSGCAQSGVGPAGAAAPQAHGYGRRSPLRSAPLHHRASQAVAGAPTGPAHARAGPRTLPILGLIPCRRRRGSGSVQSEHGSLGEPSLSVPARPRPPAVPAPPRKREVPARLEGCSPPLMRELVPAELRRAFPGRCGPAGRRRDLPWEAWGLLCCCRGESTSKNTATCSKCR